MMRVHVKVFASLCQHLPGQRAGTPVSIEIPAGANLNDLIRQLNLPQDEVKVVFVNARAQSLAYILNPGDEVGIFPPIGGG
jgi:molybdopterin synthase sulfur carrier subunit